MTNTTSSSLYSGLPNLASRLGDTSYVDPDADPMHLLLDYNSSMIKFKNNLAFLANCEHLDVRSELRVFHNLISLHTHAISEWLDQRLPLEPLVRQPRKRPRMEPSSEPNLPMSAEPQGPFSFPELPEVSQVPSLRNPLELRRTESLMGPSTHRFLEGMLSQNHENDLIHSISQPVVEDVIDLTMVSDGDDTVFFPYDYHNGDSEESDFDIDLSVFEN